MLLSARRAGSKALRWWFDVAALSAVGLCVAGAALAAASVLGARSPIDRGTDLLHRGLDAARAGDTEQALDQLQGARRAFTSGHDSLSSPLARLALAVPGLSQNLHALERASAEARDLAATGVQAARDADVEQLQAHDGQIDLAQVSAMEGPLADVLAQLRAAEAAIAEVEDQWLLPVVEDRLDTALDDIRDARPSAELALDAVRAAPGLLGGDGPRTYLVMFTTPAEGRATTGFPGNYGELTFDHGRFSLSRFGRAGDIDAALPSGGATLTGLAEYLARYDRFGVAREWRNVPMSPDFPSVASAAAQVYEQGGGRHVDGVLSLDPTAVASLLQLTGPISIPGVAQPLDATSAERYLQLDQYVRLTDNAQRIDALEQLSRLTFEKLTTIDLPGPRALGDLLRPDVEGKHLQLFAVDEQGQALFERMGVAGAVPPIRGNSTDGFDRDFAMVTTSDAGGSKIDVFLRRNLDYRATWTPKTGKVDATASITLTNDAPASGLPDYVIGNALHSRLNDRKLDKGWSYSFVTLYTPWNLTGATLDGQPVSMEYQSELGRFAVSTFVAVPPGGSSTLTIQLAGLLTTAAYRLDLGAQPLVEPEQANVSITVAGAGRVRSTGPLEAHGGTASGAFPLVSDVSTIVRRR
jgi:hypothetical protein